MKSLIAKFVACSICAGYGHDSGRSHISDDVIEDLKTQALQIEKSDGGVKSLLDLFKHESVWVRFHAAQVVLWLFPSLNQSDKLQALQTLRGLLSVDGMVALSAQVTLGVYESRAPGGQNKQKRGQTPLAGRSQS
jgi:hypothetical protein